MTARKLAATLPEAPAEPARRMSWMVGGAPVAKKPSWSAPRPAPVPAIEPSRPSAMPAAPRVSAPPPPVIISAPEPEPEPQAASADPELLRELEQLREAFARQTADLVELRRNVLAESEPELVRLALAIAERAVGRALKADKQLVVQWAREGIEALAAEEPVVVAVSPDLATLVPKRAWTTLGAELKIEAELPRWSCEVRSKDGRISVGMSSRLRAVGEVLGVGDDE